MKKKLLALAIMVILVLSACGGKAADSNASGSAKATIREGDTTDQIFFTNGITFTSSTPFVYGGESSAYSETIWQIKDMPYVTFHARVITDEYYKEIAAKYSSTTKPEGIYGVAEFTLSGGVLGAFVTDAKGKELVIYGDISLDDIISDEDYYDKVAKTGEVFLQLVDDLVKSGNASASETSGVTIVRMEDGQPLLSVYVHD